MHTIQSAFEGASSDGRCALIPYLMCGHPDLDTTVELAVAVAGAGADALELGIPFSDPLADGPTIQRAGQVALDNGVTVGDCIAVAARIRERTSIPLVFMGYWNPILQYGPARFCTHAVAAGVTALIVPDLPPEESEELVKAARAAHMATVFLVAPTSTPDRVTAAVEHSEGFVYCVALTGVTGSRATAPSGIGELLGRVRDASDLPCVVGFGISRPEHVAELCSTADGVVVGSALVDLVDRTPPNSRVEAVQSFITSLRAATSSPHPEETRS